MGSAAAMTTAVPPWPSAARASSAGSSGRAGELGGLGERRAGLFPAPGAVVGVAEREQHLGAVRGARARGQGRLVVRRGVGVGERRGRLAGGGELPASPGARAPASAARRAQVPDDLAGAHLAGVVAIGEHAGDLQVQARAARGGQRGDDRLARRARGRTRSARAGRPARRAPPRSRRRAPRAPRRPAGPPRGPACVTSNSRPQTAAASSARRVGVAEACEPPRDHVAHARRGAARASPPASCASRSSSSRKNGLPPLRAR